MCNSWVFLLAGHRPEPLLGDKDAERLRIITFRPEGKEPTREEVRGRVGRLNSVKGLHPIGVLRPNKTATISRKLRRAGVTVTLGRDVLPRFDPKGKAQAWGIVNGYNAGVFRPRVGKIKMDPVVLKLEQGFQPIQPPRHSVPSHYREHLLQRLNLTRREGVIKDVVPKERVDRVLNLVINVSRTQGEIRMNVDATPINIGAKMTKFHIKTATKVCHKLEGATYFSERDMGYGFHQVPLSTTTLGKFLFS